MCTLFEFCEYTFGSVCTVIPKARQIRAMTAAITMEASAIPLQASVY